MYGLIMTKLKERKEPVNVAIVGSGWFGGGLARELYRIDGMNPKVLIDKTPDKAVATYLELGINKSDIAVVRNSKELMPVRDTAKYIVFSDIDLIKELKDIDAVYEATGDILGGAQAALISIEKGIPFISTNFEMDATIGLRVADIASEKSVLYCNSDGDQPSVLARMIGEVTAWGFEPRIVGNCKAFLDVHQDPTGVKPFVPSHQSTHMVCGMADGTKQSIEMAVLGNAGGYYPLKKGMYGPTTTKQNLIKTFEIRDCAKELIEPVTIDVSDRDITWAESNGRLEYKVESITFGDIPTPYALGNDIWPGRNNILYVACEEKQAKQMLGCVEELRKKLGQEGIKAFILPVEELT